MIKNTNRDRAVPIFGLRPQTIQENFKNPFAGVLVGFHTRGVEDLCGEITAEEPPRCAVRSGADVMLVAADDFVCGKRAWSVSKDGAVLDQGLVGQRAIGDKDSRARADIERDDGAKLGVKVSEDWFDFGERFEKPLKVADDGEINGAWRKIGFVFGGDNNADESFDEGCN